MITVLTQTIGLKWSPSAHGPTLVGSKYRTVDGSCNNAENPLLGMGGTPFRRLLGSTYPGFDNTPRKAVDGSQLPSAREVTQTVFSLYAGIGPVDTPQCCLKDPVGRDWLYPKDPFNGQPDVCFPIEVGSSDRFWGRRGRRCMHFSRSSTSPTVTPSVCEAGRMPTELMLR